MTDSRTTIEIADRYSRKRAVIVAVAAIVFFLVYVVIQPFLAGNPPTAHFLRGETMWAINAFFLLAMLATGGGILNNRRIRALVNDEVSKTNSRTSVAAGYWVGMTTAMIIYVVPALSRMSAREAIFFIVTATVVVSLLAFSYLELRAHRDE